MLNGQLGHLLVLEVTPAMIDSLIGTTVSTNPLIVTEDPLLHTGSTKDPPFCTHTSPKIHPFAHITNNRT